MKVRCSFLVVGLLVGLQGDCVSSQADVTCLLARFNAQLQSLAQKLAAPSIPAPVAAKIKSSHAAKVAAQPDKQGYWQAGVLFYSRSEKGKLLFLLGREYDHKHKENVWTDFGGKAEKGETSAETAAREAAEETRFVLQPRATRGTQNKKASIDFITSKITGFIENSSCRYRMYLVNLEKPVSYKLFEHAHKGSHTEKQKYRWVSADELFAAARSGKTFGKKVKKHMRHCFAETIKKHESEIRKLFQ